LNAYLWLVVVVFLVAGRVGYGLINWGVWNDEWQYWLSVFSKPGTSLMTAYLGAILFSVTYLTKKDWKIWGIMEDISKDGLIFLGLFALAETVKISLEMKSVAVLGSLALTYLAVMLIEDRYRSFMWYKSGKKGFVFLAANLIFGLVYGLTLMIVSGNWWWQSTAAWLWGLICGLGLFILGGTFNGLLINQKGKKNGNR
jgi:hypothetical protein